eukprot:TRINITY_DN3702_c6_g1_i1.p1 TRINITY_DN3702_c6_g1~~TRINITY_DN3702_c6_g1_i1.p1  ORF type:complete len:456 (+),score=62.46 TRINITY_DN3702_c6_g1_i1:71-1369(+)
MYTSLRSLRFFTTWKVSGGAEWGTLVNKRLSKDLKVPVAQRPKISQKQTDDSDDGGQKLFEKNQLKIGSEEAGSWPWGDEQVARYVRQTINKEVRGRSQFKAKEVEWRGGVIGNILDEVLEFKKLGCDVGPLTVEALMRAALDDRDKASAQHIWETIIRQKLTINKNTWGSIMRYHGDNRDLDAVKWTWQAYLKAGNSHEHGHEYLKALSRCDKKEAFAFFREYPAPDEGLCQAMFQSVSNFSEGVDIIRDMERKGTFVSIRIYGAFLKALAQARDVANVEHLFGQLLRITTPNEACWNARLIAFRNTSNLEGVFKVGREAKQQTHIVLTQVEISIIECIIGLFHKSSGSPENEAYLRRTASAAISTALSPTSLLPSDQIQFAIVVYKRFIRSFGREGEIHEFNALIKKMGRDEKASRRRTSNFAPPRIHRK